MVLYPAINGNVSIVFQTQTLQGVGRNKSPCIYFLLAHRIFDFYDIYLTLLHSVNLSTLHISRHLLQGDFFLLPHNWIYKLTNSATLWIIEGHTGYLSFCFESRWSSTSCFSFFCVPILLFHFQLLFSELFFPHFTLCFGVELWYNKEQARIQMILLFL